MEDLGSDMGVRLSALKAEMLVQHEEELAATQRQLAAELEQVRAAADAELALVKETVRKQVAKTHAAATAEASTCAGADSDQVCTRAVRVSCAICVGLR